MTPQIQIKKLPKRFEQKSELFEQVFEDEKNYIYKRTISAISYFEVFQKKHTRCFDFQTKKTTGEFKEKYPKNEDFGKWAWCCRGFEEAMNYINNQVT